LALPAGGWLLAVAGYWLSLALRTPQKKKALSTFKKKDVKCEVDPSCILCPVFAITTRLSCDSVHCLAHRRWRLGAQSSELRICMPLLFRWEVCEVTGQSTPARRPRGRHPPPAAPAHNQHRPVFVPAQPTETEESKLPFNEKTRGSNARASTCSSCSPSGHRGGRQAQATRGRCVPCQHQHTHTQRRRPAA
jgi:hypothetical protein